MYILMYSMYESVQSVQSLWKTLVALPGDILLAAIIFQFVNIFSLLQQNKPRIRIYFKCVHVPCYYILRKSTKFKFVCTVNIRGL
jgi:hypothetical protein